MTGAAGHAVCAAGSWLAVAGTDCWALLELSPDDPRTSEAVAAVDGEEPIDELLDVMISQGLRRLPGFAILGWRDGRLRYVARPPAIVEIRSPGGTERIGEVTSGSWRDGLLETLPVQVTLSAPTAAPGDHEMLLAPGGMSAGRVVVTPTPASPSSPPPRGRPPSSPPPPSRWAPPTTPPPPLTHDQLPPPIPQAAVGGHPPPAGSTGTRELADLLEELARTPPRPSGPTVWAVVCPSGHLTPSYAAVCRICATPLAEDQTPVEVTRPPLGRLVLSSGGAVTLDRNVVFGRAPTSTASDPAERPHLVKPSSYGGIGRRHAEVRVEGWVVLVRDLGSANGSTLTLPGGLVQQMHAHEDYPLGPGCVVTLAGDVSLTYEATGS